MSQFQAWNKPEHYSKASMLTQDLSAVKSNEQLLTVNQCERYVRLSWYQFFIGPKFQRERCRHNGI